MTRWLVLAALAALGSLALTACGDDPYEPSFGGKCTPKSTNLGVDCTITNNGKKAGRACLTVRLLPPEGVRKLPMASRRVCTKALEPQESISVDPPFNEGFERCVSGMDWVCKVEIVETSRSMGENLPPPR